MRSNDHLLRRRVLAFWVDWTGLCLAWFLCGAAVLSLMKNVVAIVTMVVVCFVLFALFLLRDRWFGGRGIGKRLFKLRVIDQDTGKEPSLKQSVVKGFFLFLAPIDGIFLLATGKSLGERGACVAVVDEKEAAARRAAPPSVQSDDAPPQSRCRTWIIPMFLALLVVWVCAGLAAVKSMETTKQSEPYRLAYQYLTDSLTQGGEDQPDIVLTGHGSQNQGHCQEAGTTLAKRFTFLVGLQDYEVVCHKDGEVWYVCTSCTQTP